MWTIPKRSWVLGKRAEGKMLFFPSDLNHIVYPHYTTTEYRVALAGDVAMNSMAPTRLINPDRFRLKRAMHQEMISITTNV